MGVRVEVDVSHRVLEDNQRDFQVSLDTPYVGVVVEKRYTVPEDNPSCP